MGAGGCRSNRHAAKMTFLIAKPSTGHNAWVKEAGPLQFGVEKAKINWGTYFQNAIRTRGSASSQFEDYSGKGPWVVVQNTSGEKRVLEAAKKMKEARARAAAIENEYKTLSVVQWCERYASFFYNRVTLNAGSEPDMGRLHILVCRSFSGS
jgi:hypothetical protein